MIIGVWNIQGLRNKIGKVIKELESRNQDIIILSETKIKETGIEPKGSYAVGYQKINEQNVEYLYWWKTNSGNVTNWEPIEENLIKININLHGYRITILWVYALSEDELSHNKDEFFNKLNWLIEEIGNTRKVIVAGDFNSRTGRQTGSKIIGPFGENIVNDNGKRLIDICEQNSLKILNGFYQYREIHKYIWHQDTLLQKSIIDYIIIQPQIKLKIQDIRLYRGVTLNDYFLVNSKMLFPFRDTEVGDNQINHEENLKTEINIPKYNLNSLENESTIYLYRKRLNEKLTENLFDTTEIQYQYILNNLHKSAKEALGEKYNIHNKKLLYYRNEEIEKDVKIKKDKYVKWLNTPNIQDKIELNAQQAKIRKKVAKAKNKGWEQSCQKTENFIGG